MTLSRKYIVLLECRHGHLNSNIDARNFYFRSGISLYTTQAHTAGHQTITEDETSAISSRHVWVAVVPRVGVVPEKSDSITRFGDRPRCCVVGKQKRLLYT